MKVYSRVTYVTRLSRKLGLIKLVYYSWSCYKTFLIHCVRISKLKQKNLINNYYIKSNILYIYIYIYVCVCVCVQLLVRRGTGLQGIAWELEPGVKRPEPDGDHSLPLTAKFRILDCTSTPSTPLWRVRKRKRYFYHSVCQCVCISVHIRDLLLHCCC
jgi:hypothetical protein